MGFEKEVELLRSLISSGKVKTKGAYEVLPFEKLGWWKNHSAMVIPMATAMELLLNVDHEEFIRLHRDKFDFMLRTKVSRNCELVLVQDGEDIKQQNNCRYYPSKTGGSLVKLMPPLEEGGEVRRLGIDTDWKVKVCNDISQFDWKDLDYQYYITEAAKLVNSVQTE